jgi:hypothetical protein
VGVVIVLQLASGQVCALTSVKQIDLRKRKTVKRKSQPPDLILIPTFTILLCEQPNEVRAVAAESGTG